MALLILELDFPTLDAIFLYLSKNTLVGFPLSPPVSLQGILYRTMAAPFQVFFVWFIQELLMPTEHCWTAQLTKKTHPGSKQLGEGTVDPYSELQHRSN